MMVAKVFIDGEVGTTGLQIRDRLAPRADIRLVQIDAARRKDPKARRAAYAEADVAILCLPDEAARESAALAADLPVRIIDASTAHRVHPDWAFGFPELSPDQAERIAGAKRVSNPGCWSTCAIGLLAPLVKAGLIAPDAALTINGVSGYSGGGKALIAEFAAGTAGSQFIYGLDHKHKHLPEIMAHAGLGRRPVFIPSVGKYEQGMIVQIPLHLAPGQQAAAFADTLAAHYAGARFVRVVEPAAVGARANPEKLNGTNLMELSVHPSAEGDRLVLLACLDNLGKGASGAAVQNLNLMLGMDEGAGL
jgi:N-acetyl-gamma-glutamyl-phosphate reductase